MSNIHISVEITSTESDDALVTSVVKAFYCDVERVWGGSEDAAFTPNAEDILVPIAGLDECVVTARQCYAALRNDRDLFISMIMALGHLHSWPRYALPILASGASSSEVIARTRKALRENEPMSTARPGYVHTTGTGRTSWECKDGKIFIEISRPSGVVLSATIDTQSYDGYNFSIGAVEVDRYLPRHLYALLHATAPFGAVPSAEILGERALLNQYGEVKYAEEKLEQEQEELEYAIATLA